MITYINTYDIATLGHNSNSTYTFATQGFYVYVEIETITPTPTPSPTPTPLPEKPTVGIGSGGYIASGLSKFIRRKEREKRKNDIITGTTNNTKEVVVKKRVKVCVVINDKEYCKTKIVKNKPDLDIKDVDIKINDKTPKPKITIKIKK